MNDDQELKFTRSSWKLLAFLLNESKFTSYTYLSPAILLARVQICVLLKKRGLNKLLDMFVSGVDENKLYTPSKEVFGTFYLRRCIEYHALGGQEKDLTKPLMDMLEAWDSDPQIERSALMIALEKDNQMICQYLIEKNFRIDEQFWNGWTALMVACLYKKEELARKTRIN